MSNLNNSGLTLVRPNQLLIYLGDMNYFSEKLHGKTSLFVSEDEVLKAVHNTVKGTVVDAGLEASEIYKIGDKVIFAGFYGSITSKRLPESENWNNGKSKNYSYYRIMELSDIKAKVSDEHFHSYI